MTSSLGICVTLLGLTASSAISTGYLSWRICCTWSLVVIPPVDHAGGQLTRSNSDKLDPRICAVLTISLEVSDPSRFHAFHKRPMTGIDSPTGIRVTPSSLPARVLRFYSTTPPPLRFHSMTPPSGRGRPFLGSPLTLSFLLSFLHVLKFPSRQFIV